MKRALVLAVMAFLVLSILSGTAYALSGGDIVGTWRLMSVVSDNETLTPEEAGIQAFIIINADNQALLFTSDDEPKYAIWRISGDAVIFKSVIDEVSFDYSGGNLVADANGIIMSFTRISDGTDIPADSPVKTDAVIDDFIGKWTAVYMEVNGFFINIEVVDVEMTLDITENAVVSNERYKEDREANIASCAMNGYSLQVNNNNGTTLLLKIHENGMIDFLLTDFPIWLKNDNSINKVTPEPTVHLPPVPTVSLPSVPIVPLPSVQIVPLPTVSLPTVPLPTVPLPTVPLPTVPLPPVPTAPPVKAISAPANTASVTVAPTVIPQPTIAPAPTASPSSARGGFGFGDLLDAILANAAKIPAAGNGSAQDDDPEPQPTATPVDIASPSSAGGGFDLDDLLSVLADDAKDPWEEAIYRKGAEEVSREGDTVTFSLRSFDPKLKSLPNYNKDREGWLEGFFENASAYNLVVTLKLKDGEPDSASLKALKAAVTKAANDSMNAFDQVLVREAIVNLLLPTPVNSEEILCNRGLMNGDYCDFIEENAEPYWPTPVQFAPLFYAQSKQSLNVKEGPYSLKLNLTGANPGVLLEDARKATMDVLSKAYKSNAMTEEEIEKAFANELGKKAAALRKKGGEARVYTLDIDKLAQGDLGSGDHYDYMEEYDYSSVFERLVDDVRSLPDAPAQPLPKSGRISGSKSGTSVTINMMEGDTSNYYVQMRSADSDEMIVDMFIRARDSATVKVPKGMYYLLIASGDIWYGIDALFGDLGYYSSTANTEILSSDYLHTLTIGVNNGNVSMYRSDPDAFRKGR